jgi:predicted RNA-binding protein
MCEFRAFLDGEQIAEDVIYAKVEGHSVTLRDILSQPIVLENVKIAEIDVTSTRLVLEQTSQSHLS